MEKWQEIAIAEAEEVLQLLKSEDFTVADLCDRLKVWLEFLRLDPTKDPYEDTSE